MRAVLLWFGVLGAPAAWAAHLIAGFGYDEIACSAGTISNGSVIPFESALTILLAAVAFTALVAALWSWRAVRREAWPDPRGRISFMAFSGLLMSGIFGSLVVMAGIGVLTLDPCAAG